MEPLLLPGLGFLHPLRWPVTQLRIGITYIELAFNFSGLDLLISRPCPFRSTRSLEVPAGVAAQMLRTVVLAQALSEKCLMHNSDLCVRKAKREFPTRSRWSCPIIVQPKRFAAHRLALVLYGTPGWKWRLGVCAGLSLWPTRWVLSALSIVIWPLYRDRLGRNPQRRCPPRCRSYVGWWW